MRTKFGVYARATMQNAPIAQALGVKVGTIYALSFGIGAGLAGLCGALYAPTMTLIPTMGATFIVESFVTVVVGGSNVLLGTTPAGAVVAAFCSGPKGSGGPSIRLSRIGITGRLVVRTPSRS